MFVLIEKLIQSFNNQEVVRAITNDDVMALKCELQIQFKNIDLKFTQIPDIPLEIFAHNPLVTCLCAFFGSIKCLTFLKIAGFDLNEGDKYGRQPTVFSIAGGRHDILEFLISRCGANINAIDTYGATLLHFAAKFGSIQTINVLLSNGIDINIKSKRGATPLMWASQFASSEVVSELLKNGADPKLTTAGGWTALHYAANSGNISTLKVLLDRDDVDINVATENRITPLQMAVSEGFPECVDFLIKKGASMTDGMHNRNPIKLYNNPIIFAIKSDSIECFNYLIKNQMVLRSLTRRNTDACLKLICEGVLISDIDEEKVINSTKPPKLMKKGKEMPKLSINMELLHAYLELIKSNPNLMPLKPIEGYLMSLIERNPPKEAVEAFFNSFPIDLEYRNEKGDTFLHAACRTNSVDLICSLLCDHNMNPDVYNNSHETPLWICVNEECEATAEVFLFLDSIDTNAGPKPHCILKKAKELKWTKLVTLLIARGAVDCTSS